MSFALTVSVSSCESNPCHASSTCISRQGYYVCHCQPGKTGAQCGTGKSITKLNNGRNNLLI